MKKRFKWMACLLAAIWLGAGSASAAVSAESAFSFTASREALDIGEQVDFASLLQNGAAVSWESSAPDILFVSETGQGTGVKMGTAMVTAVNAGGQSAACAVTVGYYTGIDLSYANKTVDWDTVKSQGIDFAMLRTSLGWYDDPEEAYDYQFDVQLARNVQGAQRVGIPFGLYHYSYASTVEEAHWEAAYMLDAIAREAKLTAEDVALPVVLDVEETKILKEIGKEKATQIVLAFSEDIRKAGFTPMLYSSKSFFTDYFDAAALVRADVKFWMAWWPDTPDFTQRVSIAGATPALWQYTIGQLPGVTTDVDMDVLYMSDYRLHNSAPAPDPVPGEKGDVDGDGKVTSADALMTLQAATGKIKPTEAQREAADVDGDGTVGSSDALFILQYATKKITVWPE